LLASPLDFNPTWIIYKLAGQGIADAQEHELTVLLYNKPRSEKLKKAAVLAGE
jgi:hypothetical protein